MGQITWENLDSVSLDLLATLDVSYSPPILDEDLGADGRHTPRLQDPYKELLEVLAAGAPGGRSRLRFSGRAAAGGRWRRSRRNRPTDNSSAGGGVSPMIGDVLTKGLKYTHPPPPLEDGDKTATFAELDSERTATNRVNDAFSSGDFPESRPRGGENRPRKATDVYEEIVSTLDHQGRRTDLKQREVEDLLIVKLGATQRSTLARHLEIMVRLGYLKMTRGGTAYSSAEFDMVGRKLMEVRAKVKAQQLAEKTKGVRGRR